MVPHYILAGPVCFSGFSSVEQVFWVVLVEQEVMVAVEQVADTKEWEESCAGASTLDEVHSTKVGAEHKSEMNEQLVEHGIETDMTKEGVWTSKDE